MPSKKENLTPEQEERKLVDFEQQILAVIKSGKANLDAPEFKAFIKNHPRLVPAADGNQRGFPVPQPSVPFRGRPRGLRENHP